MPSDSFLEFVLDQLAPLGEVTPHRMFGGHGIYRGTVFFAIIHKGTLYFKVDEESRADYIARGMDPFRPSAKQTLKSYYEVPVEIIEDSDALVAWARRAVRAQDAAEKPAKRKPRPRK